MAPRLKLKALKGLFFMTTCTIIILRIIFILVSSLSSNSKLVTLHFRGSDGDSGDDSDFIIEPSVGQPFSSSFSNTIISHSHDSANFSDDDHTGWPEGSIRGRSSKTNCPMKQGGGRPHLINISEVAARDKIQSLTKSLRRSNESVLNDKEVFHDEDVFLKNFNQMNTTLKIYVYPHATNDPFTNIFMPANHEPGGNYASESYFKLALSKSHFITNNPSNADLFFLPFSIASMRHDKRISTSGIKDFVRDYILMIRHKYPYWNRTGGTDHFYVACHSIGRTAMDKTPEVKNNAIQVVCSSSYFLQGYITHKDASIPQIWPRQGVPPNRAPSKRKTLAFYAGAMNSRVRQFLVQTWINDTEISVHQHRLNTPYSESLLGSKFCIHAKGFEVNTARIGDAIYYGCVPVVLADHYDLPFADILNWRSFSVVVSTTDIPFLKRILKEIVDSSEYAILQKNVMKVRCYFQWHQSPIDFDAFYMVMYELWLRRSSIRVPSVDSFSSDQELHFF